MALAVLADDARAILFVFGPFVDEHSRVGGPRIQNNAILQNTHTHTQMNTISPTYTQLHRVRSLKYVDCRSNVLSEWCQVHFVIYTSYCDLMLLTGLQSCCS